MEKNNFDEEFKNRIKQVFEEYDDSTADEGWNLLREKYPEKKRRDGFFWWISSAAAVLLMAFIFWFFPSETIQKNTSKITKQHKTEVDSTSLNRYSSIKKSTAIQIIPNHINTKKSSLKRASGFEQQNLSSTNKSAQNPVFVDTASTKKTPIKTAFDFASAQKIQSKTATSNQNNTVFIDLKIDSAAIKKQQKFAIVPNDSSQKALVAAVEKANPTISKPVVKKYPETETVKKAIEKSAIFSLEVYAGSHVNYASGSNNQLGLGAGFSTDFRLSKNFKLSTGLGLMQNNLTYGQDIPRGSLDAASVTYSAATINNNAIGTITAQPPSLSNMGTRLITLDVPINLVYNFSPDKNSISVSAGISSNTFVKEAYDYHYSNSTSATQSIGSFNNFNFARTLNLAAGFAYPLGKSKLQIEPFLKYPLGGLGSQQLQFGSAGINLKMNIQSFKK